MTTMIGLLLLFAPFLLIFCFENHVRSAAYIFLGWISFHSTVSVVLLMSGSISNEMILGIHGIVAIAVLFYITKHTFPWKVFVRQWICVAALCTVGISIFSLHAIYSGEIQAIGGKQTYHHAQDYSYPYYSDEWNAVILVQDAIEEKRLPTTHPFTEKPFINFLFVFHSLITGWVLLLDIDPLHQFVFLPVLSSVLVAFVTYIFLYGVGVGRAVAALGSVLLLYITNGANFAGLWYLMPFIFSWIPFVIMMYGLMISESKIAWWGAILSFLLYPPFVVLLAPLMITNIVLHKKLLTKKSCIYGFVSLIIFLLFLLSFGSSGDLTAAIERAWSFIVRDNLLGGSFSHVIVIYNPFYIIPWPIMLLALVGVGVAIKQKYWPLLITLGVGLSMWIIYRFVSVVFIIEPARISMVTTFIIVMYAAIGFAYVLHVCRKKGWFICSQPSVRWGCYLLLMCFFLFTLMNYPVRNPSDQLVARRTFSDSSRIVVHQPAEPINRYLHRDDIKIFGELSDERFLAPAWKGLVIAAATDNNPVYTKPSFFGIKKYSHEEFMRDSCDTRVEKFQKFSIDYVYTIPFDCDHFIEIERSAEGLVLYKFK